MSLPAMKVDQRRVPRINPKSLAYLNFEPDNGGIVLNISEEGLCFHAFAPLELNAKVPFWFSEVSSGAAAEGLVVWTDDTGKTGGLRFNRLSPETRRQIRMWIDESSKSLGRPTQLVAPMPQASESLARPTQVVAAMPQSSKSSVAPSQVATPPSSKSSAAPSQVATPMPQSPGDAPVAKQGYVAASAVPRPLWSWVRALPLPRWSEFSRGLVTGLLVALSLTALFSLRTRQRIGDALIWLGERFEPTTQPRVAASSPHSATGSAAAPQLTPAPPMRVRPAPATVVSAPPPSHEKPSLPTLTTAAASVHAKLAPAATSTPAVSSPSIPTLPLLSHSSPLPSPAPPSVPVAPEDAPVHPASPEKVLAAKAVDRSGENENAEDVSEINSGIPLGKYFEVGKVKDQLAASQKRHDLEALGFRAVVLPKSLLWIKSYQVLVGPYHNEQDAQLARQNLQAHGLTPHSLGEHSRQLTVVASWTNPSRSEERDDFIVTWEAYGAEAKVKLVKEASQIGRTVTGKWVKLPTKSDYTAIVYTTGGAGAHTLLSIQFRGMNRAVMLADSGDSRIVF